MDNLGSSLPPGLNLLLPHLSSCFPNSSPTPRHCLGSGPHSLLRGLQQQLLYSSCIWGALWNPSSTRLPDHFPWAQAPSRNSPIPYPPPPILAPQFLQDKEFPMSTPGTCWFSQLPLLAINHNQGDPSQFPKPGKPIHTATLSLFRVSLPCMPSAQFSKLLRALHCSTQTPSFLWSLPAPPHSQAVTPSVCSHCKCASPPRLVSQNTYLCPENGVYFFFPPLCSSWSDQCLADNQNFNGKTEMLPFLRLSQVYVTSHLLSPCKLVFRECTHVFISPNMSR